MTPPTLDELLTSLHERLAQLDAALPAARNDDECEAITSMQSCAHDLQRFALLVGPARERERMATPAEHEQADAELHRLLHDLRTPAGVLYTYLKIVADGKLFARASTTERTAALDLAALVRTIREQSSSY